MKVGEVDVEVDNGNSQQIQDGFICVLSPKCAITNPKFPATVSN